MFNQGGEYTITSNHLENSVFCSCKKFERYGFLCCHALKVLDVMDVKLLPQQYIIKRWTREAKKGSVQDYHGRDVHLYANVSATQRYRSLCPKLVKLASRASESQEACELVERLIGELTTQIESICFTKVKGDGDDCKVNESLSKDKDSKNIDVLPVGVKGLKKKAGRSLKGGAKGDKEKEASDKHPEDVQQVAPKNHASHNAWIKGSKEIAGLMLMTMEPEIQRNLENLHANDMLKELKTLFAQQAEHELLQTTRDFHSCKQEEGQSVSSYVLKMKSYIDNLERLGHPVTLGLAVSLILIGLRKEFDGFVQNYNMHSLGKTVNELHAMLKLHEQTLPKNNAPALHAIRAGKVQKGNNKHKKQQPQMAARGQNQGKGKNKLAYAPKPKIPPPPKREDPAKDSICHECGEIGHWKRNCPQYLAELLKKKKNAAFGAGGS
ncbi:zinc finger, CCHC-type containing protein, partial [Tanacetum coccineum]